MMNQTSTTNQSSDNNPMAYGSGGSPKMVYTLFMLQLCREFFSSAVVGNGGDAGRTERAIAAMISFVPSREKRGELWDYYTTLKKKPGYNAFTASIEVNGEIISYLSDLLEFEECSTGAVL